MATQRKSFCTFASTRRWTIVADPRVRQPSDGENSNFGSVGGAQEGLELAPQLLIIKRFSKNRPTGPATIPMQFPPRTGDLPSVVWARVYASPGKLISDLDTFCRSLHSTFGIWRRAWADMPLNVCRRMITDSGWLDSRDSMAPVC